MNRGSKRALLTIRERVLLHVMAQHRFYQDADAPASLTQEGIAEAVEVGRNNVSKVVNTLSEEGLMDVLTKHVKGFSSIKKIYVLTPAGFQTALELKQDIEGTNVLVIDFDGKRHETEVSKLGLFLPKKFTLLELALGVERGKFDCTSFHEGKIREERRYIDFTDRKPAIRVFFGRANEMRRLTDFLDSPTSRVMVICGIPGIGKTTLLAKFVQEIKDQRNVFWYQLHEWVNLKIMLTPVAEFLSHLGKKGLERYLGRTETPSVSEVCSILESELKDVPIVIILDDVQKAEAGVLSLLSALVNVLEGLPKASLLCTSREIPSFYSRSSVFKGQVVETMLEGLDHESSMQLLRSREINESSQEEIYKATRGHPLFLELVESPKSALGKNIRMFIDQEVYSKLDLSERRILEIASVFRYPVLIDAFFTVEEEVANEYDGAAEEKDVRGRVVDYDAIDLLQSKSMLHESLGRMVGMHDLLREFFYSRLTPKQRRLYHKAASTYYAQDSSPPSQVEALFHCLKAREYQNAVRIIVSNGHMIISKGYGPPFAQLIRELLEHYPEIRTGDKMEAVLLEGEVLDIQGEWDYALTRFQEVLSLAIPRIDKRIISDANRRIGAIYLRRGIYEKAKPYLDISMEIAVEINDNATLNEVLYDLGGLYERQSQTDDALAAFTKSVELSKTIGDYIGLGKALYGIGRVYLNLTQREKSIQFMIEALGVLEKTGDVNEIAKVCTTLGLDYLDLERYEEALKYHNKAIDLARSSGNLSTLAYAMSNAAACHLELGDLVDAEELIAHAALAYKKLNDRILLATMHLYRGFLYSKRGEWEWAKEEFRTSLDMVRAINSPQKLGRWLFEVGQEYQKNHDYCEAKVFLNEALFISSNENQENLRKQVEQAMNNLPAIAQE